MSGRLYNPFQSALYNLLVKTAWLDDIRVTARYWQAIWRRTCAALNGTVRTTIHGRPALASYGHTYPIYARKFHTLNNPLIELVHQCYATRQSPITLVDIGANIGDTIMLLDANCTGQLGRYICVEGDAGFFRLLEHNLGADPRATLLRALLSDAAGQARALLRTNAGTASARGEHTEPAHTLDTILSSSTIQIDVLKSDVDGFDGKVLAGAEQLLQRDHPAVIFEWHPILCQQTGNDWCEHFRVLAAGGYNRFIWFTKHGNWSHFTSPDDAGVTTLANFCLRSRTHADWHYDIIALHDSSRLSPYELADLPFARRRSSFY